MANYFEDIISALQKPMPGSVSHMKLLPAHRKLMPMSGDNMKLKKSSVLFLLCEDNGLLFLCLIKRPVHMKNHAGQIAMPGGKCEKNETAAQTALRETFEEIGVPEKDIRIIGQLSEVHVSVSGFSICPVIGWMNKIPAIKLNHNEVESVMFLPIFESDYKIVFQNVITTTGPLDVPCYVFKNEVIWGATAMILSEFFDLTREFFF
jgi:8-oxo-dGTP pyrophosphatase MutT (NUDIX family)